MSLALLLAADPDDDLDAFLDTAYVVFHEDSGRTDPPETSNTGVVVQVVPGSFFIDGFEVVTE